MKFPLSGADVTLIVIILGIGGMMWFTGGSDYEPSQFCLDAAEAAEGNLSQGYTGVDCHCEGPSQYIRGINATTPEAVMNVTEVNDILICNTEQFQDSMVFPLLQINKTKYNRSGGLNGSLDNSMFANTPVAGS